MTEITEGIWKHATSFFDFGEVEIMVVYRICPECNRFIKQGKVSVNLLGDAKFEEWICKKHGEVRPRYEWIDG